MLCCFSIWRVKFWQSSWKASKTSKFPSVKILRYTVIWQRVVLLHLLIEIEGCKARELKTKKTQQGGLLTPKHNTVLLISDSFPCFVHCCIFVSGILQPSTALVHFFSAFRHRACLPASHKTIINSHHMWITHAKGQTWNILFTLVNTSYTTPFNAWLVC